MLYLIIVFAHFILSPRWHVLTSLKLKMFAFSRSLTAMTTTSKLRLSLIVRDTYVRPLAPQATEARFKLLICPACPLKLGQLARLQFFLPPGDDPDFFLDAPSASIIPSRTNIWGKIIGARLTGLYEMEFELENINEQAQIRHAFIRVPCYPGRSVNKALWNSCLSVFLEHLNSVSQLLRFQEIVSLYLDKQHYVFSGETPRCSDWSNHLVGVLGRSRAYIRHHIGRISSTERYETCLCSWLPVPSMLLKLSSVATTNGAAYYYSCISIYECHN